MSGKARVSDSSEEEGPQLGGLFDQRAPRAGPPVGQTGKSGGGPPAQGLVREAPVSEKVYGYGRVPVDKRKFKYDRIRGQAAPALAFNASKVDRMDAEDAGELLDRLHVAFGIDKDEEAVLLAFDKALFFEHTINGASMLQPGKGALNVGNSAFDLAEIKRMLGRDQRQFFRAYADEISEVNREVLNSLDPYDHESVEKHGKLMQVAVLRGLQKYPYLAHDSSDAGLRLSVEERIALAGSKRVVLATSVNNVDKEVPRVGGGDSA